MTQAQINARTTRDLDMQLRRHLIAALRTVEERLGIDQKDAATAVLADN